METWLGPSSGINISFLSLYPQPSILDLNVTDMLVINDILGPQLLMGHREPADPSVIQITYKILYLGIPKYSKKNEKPQS